MALPTVQAVGTYSGATTGPTITLPTHATNDILLLFVETTGGQAVSAPSGGWAHITNSPQATGAGTAGTQLSVFWLRAAAAGTTNPVLADAGDHTGGVAVVIRGVATGIQPWDLTAGGVKATASTSTSIAGVTTTGPDRLLIYASSRDNDSASANWSGESNGNLASLTEQFDAGTAAGNGGGVGIWTGTLANAGASGTLTATSANSVVEAFIAIAMVGVPGFTESTLHLSDTGNGVTQMMNRGWVKISESLTAQMQGDRAQDAGPEPIKLADTVSTTLDPLQGAPATDSLKIADTVTTVNNLGVQPTESLKIAESGNQTLDALEGAPAGEAVKVQDTVTALIVLLANVQESLKIVDTSTTGDRTELIGTFRLADGPVQAALTTGGLLTSATETVKIAETVTPSIDLVTTPSEALKLAETVTVSRDLTASLQEDVHVVDTTTPTEDPLETSQVEALHVVDTATPALQLAVQQPDETLHVVDTATPAEDPLLASLQESLRVADSLSVDSNRTAFLADENIKLSDGPLLVALDHLEGVAQGENLRISESASGTPTLNVTLPVETVRMSDRVVILSVSLSEGFKLSDAGQGQTSLIGAFRLSDGPPIVSLSNLLSGGPADDVLRLGEELFVVRTPLEATPTEVMKLGIGAGSAAELIKDEWLVIEDTVVAGIGTPTDRFASVSETLSMTDGPPVTARTLEQTAGPESLKLAETVTASRDFTAVVTQEAVKLADSVTADEDRFILVTQEAGKFADTDKTLTLDPEQTTVPDQGVRLADTADAALINGNDLSLFVQPENLKLAEPLLASMDLNVSQDETVHVVDIMSAEGPAIEAFADAEQILISDASVPALTPLRITVDEESVTEADTDHLEAVLALPRTVQQEQEFLSDGELVVSMDLSTDTVDDLLVVVASEHLRVHDRIIRPAPSPDRIAYLPAGQPRIAYAT